MCTAFERPPAMNGISPVKATSVIQIVEAYGGDETDVDKALTIERELYPVIAEQGGKSARD